MTDDAVKKRRGKLRLGLGFAEQMAPDLPKSEKIEVIDDEGRYKHEGPAAREPPIKQYLSPIALNIPYSPAEGLPKPEHQEQRGAARQHERASLYCGRNDAREEPFKPWTG